MSAFEWLNQLMIWLGKWVPRPVLITAGNRGVWFGRKGDARELPPGLYWYWPIAAEVKIVSVRVRTCEIAAQLNGHEAVSIAIQFVIWNPIAALLTYNDVFSQLDDRAQGHLRSAYAADKRDADIAAATAVALGQEFEANGVRILAVSIIQRGRVIALKTLSDWVNHAKAELC